MVGLLIFIKEDLIKKPEKILEIGECPIHRPSFLKKIYEKK